MWRYIKQIFQVIKLATAMLVSCSHVKVLFLFCVSSSISIQQWLDNNLHMTLKWPSKIVITWNPYPSIFSNIQQKLSLVIVLMTLNDIQEIVIKCHPYHPILINTQQWLNYYSYMTLKWPSKYHCQMCFARKLLW